MDKTRDRNILTASSQDDPFSYQEGGEHYLNFAIQPTHFILCNSIPFCEGNVIKYVCRWRWKNGLDDLRKARHYLDLLIAHNEPADVEDPE